VGGSVGSIGVRSGRSMGVPRTKVRPIFTFGSSTLGLGYAVASKRAFQPAATADRGHCDQAAVGADVADTGCGIRPNPRGIGETTYTMAPNTMIDSTLITQSRIVIAVASGKGTP
jgi:hypothetical protein